MILRNFSWCARRGGKYFQIFDCGDAFDGLLPWMQGQVEEAPVDWHEQAMSAERVKGAHSPFRTHVDVGPEWMRCANLKHGQVKRPEGIADIAKTWPLTGVGTVVDAARWSNKREGSP